jgi:hypothetical protein
MTIIKVINIPLLAREIGQQEESAYPLKALTAMLQKILSEHQQYFFIFQSIKFTIIAL